MLRIQEEILNAETRNSGQMMQMTDFSGTYKVSGESPCVIPTEPFDLSSRIRTGYSRDMSAAPILNSSMDDIDQVQIVRLRQIIEKYRGEKALLQLDDEDLLKELGLITNLEGGLVPTFAGILLLGKEERIAELLPAVDYAFQVLDGASVRENQHFRKPLLEVFEIFERSLDAWNPCEEVLSGFQYIPVPRFSKIAFREGLVNAFSHRDYSIFGTIRIEISSEGLTLDSPGAFLETVPLKGFVQADSKSRNPLLAEIFKRIGLSSRRWRGIYRIYEESIRYGKPVPDYSESTENFVRLYFPDYPVDEDFMLRLMKVKEVNLNLSLSINTLLTLSALQSGKPYSRKELQEILNIGCRRMEQIIFRLDSLKLVRPIVEQGEKKWMLDSSFHPNSYMNADLKEEKEDQIPYRLASGADQD